MFLTDCSTKQRKVLIDTLERHRDETLSADQIIDLLGEDKISRSAVLYGVFEKCGKN